METYEDYKAHESKSSELLDGLLEAVNSQIPESALRGLNVVIGAGQFDEAIESILDLSGASHLFVIPNSFIPKIRDWLDYFGTPEPDDDDYLWYSAERAIEYSRSQTTEAGQKQKIELDIPKPEYELVAQKAASTGTSPQELIVSWIKDRVRDHAYA